MNSGLWISDNGAGKATTYDGSGNPIPAGARQIVTIPTPDGKGTAAPTGVATNATGGFVISSGDEAGPSNELFATEDGTIAGWNPNVDAKNAVLAVDNSASDAVYKGLALGFDASGAFLYATNFHAGTVDVFDSNFRPVHTSGGFHDPKIPSGFAPLASPISTATCTSRTRSRTPTNTMTSPGPATGSSTSSIRREPCSSGSRPPAN